MATVPFVIEINRSDSAEDARFERKSKILNQQWGGEIQLTLAVSQQERGDPDTADYHLLVAEAAFMEASFDTIGAESLDGEPIDPSVLAEAAFIQAVLLDRGVIGPKVDDTNSPEALADLRLRRAAIFLEHANDALISNRHPEGHHLCAAVAVIALELASQNYDEARRHLIEIQATFGETVPPEITDLADYIAQREADALSGVRNLPSIKPLVVALAASRHAA